MSILKKPNILHIKFWRNNIFLNLSTFNGKLLYKCSSGYIKSEQQKNLSWVLISLIKLISLKVNLEGNFNINIILAGAVNKSKLSLIYNQLSALNFIIQFIHIADKIPHNGCRMKVKRTQLRKRAYLG